MILAKIYPFARKDIKMKLDKIKEEIANIRRTQNMFATILIAVLGYFFTEVQPNPTIRTVSACATSMALGVWLLILRGKMKDNLSKLEKLKKDE
ncbi:hypothetical protein ABV837_001257 [Campylobacter upsaliensis]|nr:hypothetical protein [Campylobacter upsaliensis]EAH8208504.1 hypothetical protein [Campylobacter upsaliensis]EAJ7578883.1 hypothetical protein [Campylobacter upsaliensis]EAK9899701.1 hypothetical protein [Campylobacter upsaliensis]EHR9974746.1 hypothetical protein [Campylobacter upsaliensis]